MGGPGTKFEAVLFKWISSPIKFQMFTITSAVPSDIPLLASSKQQRFAMDNQDVLPQGPVQPAHGPVGPHSGQPPPLWHNSFHSKKCCSSPSKECCSMCLLGTSDTAEFWKSGKILKIRQNFENRAKFWKLGQNFENRAKFWKWGKILMRVISPNFLPGKMTRAINDARPSNARQIPPKIGPTNPRVIYKRRARVKCA